MENINQMNNEEIINLIKKNNTLREAFNDYVMDMAMDIIDERIAALKNGLGDYCIGFYNNNYMKINTPVAFLHAVEGYNQNFGLSTKAEKKLNQCMNLYRAGSNLFEFEIYNLKDIIYAEEIKADIDFFESLSYKIYSNDFEDITIQEYLDEFIINGGLDCYQYDESEDVIYKLIKC